MRLAQADGHRYQIAEVDDPPALLEPLECSEDGRDLDVAIGSPALFVIGGRVAHRLRQGLVACGVDDLVARPRDEGQEVQ